MEPLKIFSISKNDWAGCAYFLSEAINDTMDHFSRSARLTEPLLEFPYDLIGLTGQRVHLLVEWCDLIHIHDEGYGLPINIGKPVVITYHGTKFRRNAESHIQTAIFKGWLPTVATPDLTQFGLPLLPDCRPDLSKYRDPDDEFTVIHSPTKRDVKGTKRVIRACKRLNVKLDLIENEPWEECMKRKGRGHLVIDQFDLGYGCSAIEAWSMGLPIISDGSDAVIDAIEKSFSYLPFARPEPMLEDAIARLRDDVTFWAEQAAIGHQHYLNYHCPKAAAKLALWVYKQILTRFKKRGKYVGKMAMRGQMKNSDLILVRYIGGNSGETKWFAPSGVKYYFSGEEPARYVYAEDVKWFLGVKGKADRPLFIREIQ